MSKLYLKPALLVYDECKLRYDQFTLYTDVYCRNSILYYRLPWKRYNFNSQKVFFILDDFFFFLNLMDSSKKEFDKHEKLSKGALQD